MCQWGANMKPCTGYRMGLSPTAPAPHDPPNRGGDGGIPNSNFTKAVGDMRKLSTEHWMAVD